jgi:hypothetical protein
MAEPPKPPARRSILPFAIVFVVLALVGAAVLVSRLSSDQGSPPTGVAEPIATYHTIDRSLTVGRADIPGLDGRPDRIVAAVVAPDGTREEFVENEVTIHTEDPAELQLFLDRYDGEVLRASGPMTLEGSRAPAQGDLAGWYLISVDPDRASLDGLNTRLSSMAPAGEWRFSSDSAARLVALASQESDLDIALNHVADVSTCTVCEHPVAGGGNLDAEPWWWLTEGAELSIGVVHAWDYLRYQGFPPTTSYFPVKVAVVDSGFDLDEATGLPLYGGPDYGAATPSQLDEIDGDLTAGGEAQGFANCAGNCWHGQETFGVCCANGRNYFGAVGTSGGITAGARVETLLIRVGPDTWTIATGVDDALYNKADVIVTNVNLDCGWICRWFDSGNYLKAAVRTAAHVAPVVAPSGNAPPGQTGDDLGDNDMYPCQLAGVVCVGAIQRDRTAWDRSNWGAPVDIWAPTGILSAVTRTSANRPGDTDDIGQDELAVMGGTSASAPFVGGVVALMLALDPGVTDVESILIATASPVSSEPRIATGYVDAYGALTTVKPNRPPSVTITQPANGSSVSRDGVALRALVDDPEKGGPWGHEFENTITFVSDRDGLLCSTKGTHPDLGCIAPTLSLGEHEIEVVATDAFDASASATVTVVVVDNPLTAVITAPPDGIRHPPTDVNLVGYGFDPDEVIPGTALTWSSDIDGFLGSGASLWVALSPGTHTIMLTATDSQGVVATASIRITIAAGDGYPSATITAPPNNTLVTPGLPVILEGIVTDPEDGTITGRSLTWTSDIDGFLGTGSPLEVTLSGPPCTSTVHRVTLQGVDQDDNRGSHTITINVVELC